MVFLNVAALIVAAAAGADHTKRGHILKLIQTKKCCMVEEFCLKKCPVTATACPAPTQSLWVEAEAEEPVDLLALEEEKEEEEGEEEDPRC